MAHKLAIALFSLLFVGLVVVAFPYADICAHTKSTPDKHQEDACSTGGGSATNTPMPASSPTQTQPTESGATATATPFATATPPPGINIEMVMQTEAQPTVASPQQAPATGRGE